MTLGIVFIVLGALPVLYAIWRLYRSDPASFIEAVLVAVGVVGSLVLVGCGVALVAVS